MIYIIHGDDIVSSRRKLDEFLSQSAWVVTHNEKSKLSDVINSFESKELFSKQKTVIIENVLGFKKNDREKLLPVLLKCKSDKAIDVVIWQDSTIPSELLNRFKGAQLFLFSLPKFFFTFLDSLTPQNGEKLIAFLSHMQHIPQEQIFYAMVKRVRLLLMLQTGKLEEFSETRLLAPWQVAKLKKQTSLWTQNALVNFYKKLFELEVGLKTSQLPLSLGEHLDILFLTAL